MNKPQSKPLAGCLIGIFLASLMTPALADVASYQIDPEHTFPSLEFSHMGLSVWRGKFNRTTGTITLDRAARTGSVNVQVDTTSIDFGLDSMNAFAVQPDWLNAPKFPLMLYKGAIVYEGDQPVAVDGQLTLRGLTQPLKLSINSFLCLDHPFYKKEVCGADAEGVLNRADFGITRNAEGEAGMVRLRIQVEALQED